MKVYRASDYPEGQFWMTHIDNAIAYLHNGHLGGDNLYSTQIDLDSLLDLTDRERFHRFMENILGDDYLGSYPDYTDVIELPRVRAEVKTYGKIGILFTDNYPANAEAIYVFEPLRGTLVKDFIDTQREVTDQELADTFTLESLKSANFLYSYIANTLGISEDRIEASLDIFDDNYYAEIEVSNRDSHPANLELNDE